MKKIMLVFVALLFSANFALAVDDCDGAYTGTCLENVDFGERILVTTDIPAYPDCEIVIRSVEAIFILQKMSPFAN